MKRLAALFFQAVGVVTVACILAGGIGLYFAGHWLQVDDPLETADAIVPLAGDKHRLIHAADLFHQGWSKNVLLSLAKTYPPTALTPIEKKLGYPQRPMTEEYTKFMEVLDVPKSALSFFGDGHVSTAEEAEALKARVGDRPITLILVTSPYHARRAKLIFQSIMPQAKIIMTVTPYEPFETRWWNDRDSAIKMVLEGAKTLYYLLGGIFRSTDAGA